MSVETGEFLKMVRRMLRAAGRRVAEADKVELSDLVALQTDVEEVIQHAVDTWRKNGRSWATIGEALGLSKQGAHQRYGRKGLLNATDTIG